MSSMKTGRKRFFILDGYALLFRAHFALIRNPLITSYGLNTSALFGFINQLLKIIKDEDPEYFACAFDSKGKTFRHDMYEEYKANRPPMPEELQLQLPHLWEILESMNIPVLKKKGVEADDIIGTLCEKYGDTENIMIISGDKDFQQLQRYSKVKQYSPITKKNIKLTREQAEEYLVDHIIGGDTGDGVPNVLSQDDVFVSGLRQRPLSKKKRETIKDPLVMNDNEIDRNLQRNRSLIDLTYIPNEYKKEILHEFDNVEVASRSGLLTYFINNRLMDLQESIGDF